MYKYNFIYELKTLLRSGWIQFLSVLLLVLFGFASFNGSQKVEKRELDIASIKKQVNESDQKMLAQLDSIERGLSVNASRWTIPSGPTAVGNYHPRIAAMPPSAMAFIATGQSDLFTHYVKPTMAGDDFALNFTEISSPVQQLFGSFDLSFVIIYLLPLIIIAFSYNILTSERETGSLKLLASQPISIHIWVLQKIGIRFLWIATLTVILLWGTLLIFGDTIDLGTMFSFIGLTIAYILFWFALAFVVNLQASNSAKNAITILGLWLVFVLLAPSIINQLGSTIYPMPSRTLMINKMRTVKAEVTEKQDEILDNFLRDHPEYAINDPNQSRRFYHRYMASQDVVKKELEPIVSEFENQLDKQQTWVGKLKWISPAIVMQQALNEISGSSTKDYENYRGQVIGFAETWRQHLIPFLYNNQSFTSSDYKDLPSFTFKPLTPKTSGISALAILAISVVMGTIGIAFSPQVKSSKTLLF
ncbi:DUF3526 domain-containing protein [Flagellimonas sp. W118]|uniref:DUF3526 domain-containing protein n=1 Tax=Flagellimonas sp. W118 TaxID=3410791 RepID=UPI003BF4929F